MEKIRIYDDESMVIDRKYLVHLLAKSCFNYDFEEDEFGYDFSSVPSYLYRDVVLEAVKKDCMAFDFISEELKNDREIVLEAIKQDGILIFSASEDLQNDRTLFLKAVKNIKDSWCLFITYPEKFKGDKEIVFETTKALSSGLYSASEELKNNKDFVLKVVKENGEALKYASDELKNDKEVVLEAVKHEWNGFALEFASEELKNDKEIALEAVKNGCPLYILPSHFYNDNDIKSMRLYFEESFKNKVCNS